MTSLRKTEISLELSRRFFTRPQHPGKSFQRVVEFVDHSLLERDDSVIGDRDALRADLGAAFGYVAIADALGVLQIAEAILGVERMHLQRGGIHEQPRADELLLQVMIADHMADVLAQEAFDTLAEFLDAIDVLL